MMKINNFSLMAIKKDVWIPSFWKIWSNIRIYFYDSLIFFFLQVSQKIVVT